jgi:hypothetical protein
MEISEEQLRKIEGCVVTIDTSIQRAAQDEDREAALRQVREANLLISSVLQEIKQPTPQLGERTPPKESTDLSKRFKKDGKLY